MLRKSLITLSMAALAAFSALAVPAKRGLQRTVTLPDGTTAIVNIMGDESRHSYTLPDGRPVVVTSGSDAVYADPADPAAIAASRARVPSVGPATSQVPTSGSPRFPVLLLAYKDYAFRDGDDAINTFRDFFDQGEESARQYFIDQSNGAYTPEFDIYGPYTLSGKRSVYGGNDSSGYDKGVGKMVAEGVQGLNGQIDYSQYDNNGDGECDVILVIYAGDGEADSSDPDAANSVWPCQWELSSSEFGRYLTLDGVKVDKFAVFNELYGGDLTQIDGIGAFCHEFSHCLGLPDFYDTNYGGHFGMSVWSLMDYGCYNNDGYTPIGYSAYEKAFMGWIEIPEGEPGTQYELPALNQKSAATDKAIRITSDAKDTEYFIVENRQKQGWDRYMPADGLLITHVDYLKSAWDNNTVNNYATQRMTPIPADNKLYDSASSYLGDLWPYGSATELTDDSTPPARLNTGKYMGKPVTEMTRNASGTISFWYIKGSTPQLTAPAPQQPTEISADSFTAVWSHDDLAEGASATYTLEVREHLDGAPELVSEADFSSQNGNDWTIGAEGFADYELDGLRLGSNRQTGSVSSPAFTTGDDGVVTVWLNAEYYNSDGSSAAVSLLDASGNTIDTELVDLDEVPADYCTTLTARAGTSVRVQVACHTPKQRLILYTAKVYRGDASDTSYKAPAATLTFDGITGLSHRVTGLTENGAYDFRVKAVPTDSEAWAESPWSDWWRTVELSPSSLGLTLGADGSESAPVYYNLQGQPVASPAPGAVYIRLRGSRADKVRL